MISPSKYIFFGTPDFAAIILEKLITAHIPPALVVCNPDKPVGRKKIITPPPTKLLATQHNIPVSQPEKLEINKLGKADFAVVAAYSKILPKEIVNFFSGGVVGVHPSLLPRHRGASPIQSAILEGDEVTGVTLYLLDEKMDTGPILAGREFSTHNLQFTILQQQLAKLGAELLIETLPKFINGEIKPQAQNEEYATYTKKFKTEDAYVDPDDLREAQDGGSLEKATEIERKIRALNPEPGVWTMQNGKRVKLLEAEIVGGKPRRPKGVGAPTFTSELKLKKIQFEGKKPRVV